MNHGSAKPGVRVFPLSLIYFIMFLVSAWLGARLKTFHFPTVGPEFAAKMVADVAVAAFLGLAVSLITVLVAQKIQVFRKLMELFVQFFEHLTPGEVFFLAAFSALGEEFLFRGVIQPYLGWVATSFLFGLLHVGPDRRFVPWTIFGILAGLFLGGLYEWLDNLLAPVAAHFVINYVNLKLMLKWRSHHGASSS
jgi:uncharacterized protein